MCLNVLLELQNHIGFKYSFISACACQVGAWEYLWADCSQTCINARAMLTLHSFSNRLSHWTPVHSLAYIRGYKPSPRTFGDSCFHGRHWPRSQVNFPVLLRPACPRLLSKSLPLLPPSHCCLLIICVHRVGWLAALAEGLQALLRPSSFYFFFRALFLNLHICFQVCVLSLFTLEYNLVESRPLLYIIYCHIPKTRIMPGMETDSQ